MFKQTFKDAWQIVKQQQRRNQVTKTQLSSSTLMPKTLCVILKYVDPSIKKIFSKYIKIYNDFFIFFA